VLRYIGCCSVYGECSRVSRSIASRSFKTKDHRLIIGSSSRASTIGNVSCTHKFILTSCEVVSLGTSQAGQWSADGLSFASTRTIAYERLATALTPNKPPHLRNGISFRVCCNLSQMILILTHVPAGPIPEAKAKIVWCK